MHPKIVNLIGVFTTLFRLLNRYKHDPKPKLVKIVLKTDKFMIKIHDWEMFIKVVSEF